MISSNKGVIFTVIVVFIVLYLCVEVIFNFMYMFNSFIMTKKNGALINSLKK